MTAPDNDIARGELASQVLSNPVFREAWADLEAAYIALLIDTDKKDDDARYRLSEGVKVLRMVRRHLETVMETGQAAAKHAREVEKGRRPFF